MARLIPEQLMAAEAVLKPHILDPAISVAALFLEALDAFTQAGPAKRSKGTRGATRLPDDTPTKEQKDRACGSWRDVGRHDLTAKVEEIAQAFRDYHLAHGSQMESWSHAWATWYKRQVQFHKPSGPLALVSGAAYEETTVEGWVKRLEMFAGRDGADPKTWRPVWGPSPLEAACKCPESARKIYRERYPRKTG